MEARHLTLGKALTGGRRRISSSTAVGGRADGFAAVSALNNDLDQSGQMSEPTKQGFCSIALLYFAFFAREAAFHSS
jgi:hypothetical protein